MEVVVGSGSGAGISLGLCPVWKNFGYLLSVYTGWELVEWSWD